jgi:hypothetical protein
MAEDPSGSAAAAQIALSDDEYASLEAAAGNRWRSPLAVTVPIPATGRQFPPPIRNSRR